MRIGWWHAAVFTIAVVPSASAMQFSSVRVEDFSIVIRATGPIVPGDTERLDDFIGLLPQAARILGFLLDSPGGSVVEAEQLAAVVHSSHATVGVLGGGKCASACFLVFAAAETRFAAPDALIGVHSAGTDDGEETPGTLMATTLMARDLAAYGVPPAIIGKLVTTEPGRMEWLVPSDLAQLGVTTLAAPPPVRREAPAPGLTGDTPDPGTAFQHGLADREQWETWFKSLLGEYQAGAEYWSGQRSLPKPGSCFGPAGQSLGDWTKGCIAARQRLAPTDIRRKSEPDYRRGWNSYRQSAGSGWGTNRTGG
jgi:hypothetical protein